MHEQVAVSSGHRSVTGGVTGSSRHVYYVLRGHYRAARQAGLLREAVRTFAPEVLVVRWTPYDWALDAVLEAADCPVIAEVNAVLDDEAAIAGTTRFPESVYRRELRHVREADAVTTVTQEVAEQVVGLGVGRGRITVVRNGVDPVLFAPGAESEPETRNWASQYDAVLALCGSMFATLDTSTMATAMRELSLSHPRLGFLFIGPTRDALVEHLELTPGLLNRTRCTGPVAHGRVPEHLCAATIAWAAFRNEYGSPLKLYEYMAMALPVAIAAKGEAQHVVDSAKCGKCVARWDSVGLAEAIARLLDLSPAERSTLGIRGRRWVRANATWRQAAKGVLGAVGVSQSQEGH